MIEKTGPTIYKGESIYKSGAGGGGGGDLPEGYTRAKYATNSGRVRLTYTGLDLNYNDTYIIEMSIKDFSGALLSGGFCAKTSTLSLSWDFQTDPSLAFLPRYVYNGSTKSEVNWGSYPQRYLIRTKAYKRKCQIDCNGANYHKTITFNSDASNQALTSLDLFDRYVGGVLTQFEGTIYSLKVFDENTNNLKADFIPCYDPNNVLGFYEKVSGQFQGSANLFE